ncbi:hypothetical protein, partial [Streptomyces sp. NPDC054837]
HGPFTGAAHRVRFPARKACFPAHTSTDAARTYESRLRGRGAGPPPRPPGSAGLPAGYDAEGS